MDKYSTAKEAALNIREAEHKIHLFKVGFYSTLLSNLADFQYHLNLLIRKYGTDRCGLISSALELYHYDPDKFYMRYVIPEYKYMWE